MNTVTISFKGVHYTCAQGSKRAYALNAAIYAKAQGDSDLAAALCTEALKLSAFEETKTNG